MKILYMILSLIFLGAGVVGIVVPGLPTTPLVLLASYFGVNASPRFNSWFKSTKMSQNYVDPFIEHRSMTRMAKIKVLSFASIMLIISFILVKVTLVRIILVLIAITKYTYFYYFIETDTNDK